MRNFAVTYTNKMSKGGKIAIAASALLLVIAGASAYIGYRMLLGPCITAPDHLIYIDEQSTPESVMQDLESIETEGNLKGIGFFMKRGNYAENIRTGCYTIRTGDSARSIYNRLASGNQTPVRVTIRSRRTSEAMAADIAPQLMLDSAAIASRLTDPSFLAELGYDLQSVYSLIIPDTYEFWWNVTPDDFFARMKKETDAFWNDSRRAKADALGLTPLQVVTLASIVEEETAKNDEMPVVAGLYLNRLKIGMLLQADPTVIFALGPPRPKRVLNQHLKVESPYNTYLHAGLPPGPIRYVSTTAVNAVLNPARHNWLYMCAKEDFSGYHNFASTLSQHNVNAQKYQRALNAAGIR